MALTEHERVMAHRTRARLVGAPASLSLEQWEQTIMDFNGKCAYCLERQFDVLEHFIPVAIAGTTIQNCIPACYKCNHKKRDCTGKALYMLFGEDVIKRIERYLTNRSSVLPDHPVRYQRQIKMLEDKPVYTMQELVDCLPCKFARFSRLANVTECAIRDICKGRAARKYTLEKILQALSQVYGRPFNFSNVIGLKVFLNRETIYDAQDL